jgi:hypothetical protein
VVVFDGVSASAWWFRLGSPTWAGERPEVPNVVGARGRRGPRGAI